MNNTVSPLQVYLQLINQLQKAQPKATKERTAAAHVPRPRKPAPRSRAALVQRQMKARP